MCVLRGGEQGGYTQQSWAFSQSALSPLLLLLLCVQITRTLAQQGHRPLLHIDQQVMFECVSGQLIDSWVAWAILARTD